MSFTANTFFEVNVSNISRNNTQNVAGKFGSFAGSTFTPADCSAGFLVKDLGLIPCAGYTAAGLKNGNTHYFGACTNGNVTGLTGDHTGIYACNTYDVNKAISGSNANNKWNIGFDTLGLGIPADVIGDYTELIVGEHYTFGVGNLSGAPTSGQDYATIVNGVITPASSAPQAGSGVYLKLLRTRNINAGALYEGVGYEYQVLRTAQA